MKTLNQLRDEIHENAKNKGFYDDPREIGTLLMLIVSELSEAMEADRKDWFCDLAYYEQQKANSYEIKRKQETGEIPVRSRSLIQTTEEIEKGSFEYFIKDRFEDELADTIIRILDLCGYLNIDIETHVDLKMKYNQTREYKHGKNY